MRRTASEKMEIIRLVEGTDLPVRATLRQLDVPRSTFYDWYQRYEANGFDGLHDKKPGVQPRWLDSPSVRVGLEGRRGSGVWVSRFGGTKD